MNSSKALHAAWRAFPYWLEACAPMPAGTELPNAADVVIVGSGYAGMAAARALAQAGLAVVVLEAGDIGQGASTRNHGMISGGFKLPRNLAHMLGENAARELKIEARRTFDAMEALILPVAEKVEYRRTGRLIAAYTKKAFDAFPERAAVLKRDFGYTTKVLDASELHSELKTDFYRGGLLVEEAGGVHPAKLHAYMRSLAESAGVALFSHTPVTALERIGRRTVIRTGRGSVSATEVVVATNAYSHPTFGYLARRLVPVTAYICATQELPSDLLRELIPNNRMIADTKRALYALRLSPDRKRIIFAGRAKFGDLSEREATPILHRFICSVFPDLEDFGITHTWKGLVAFTLDALPHISTVENVHYIGGCQGNGVAMMTHLGKCVAEKIVDQGRICSAFDLSNFAAIPLYSGTPWFLPAIGAYYKLRDTWERWSDR